MATSLLLWHSSNQKTGSEEEHENNVTEEEETRPENVKQKGRKGGKSKGTSQKKQPQRGLGVAQLERLRLQERWKKITVVDQVQTQKHCNQFPFSYIDQPNGVSVPTSVRSGPVNYGAFIDGQSSSKQAFGFHPYRLGNSGFHGSGGGSGMRAMFSDQLSTDRHQISVQEARHQNGNLFQASKELSSTKKKHCLSDHCEICFKKKRINGENMEYNGGRGKYSETMPIDGCDFLALNLGRSKTIDGESRDFSARGARRAASPGLNADKQELEVVAIHRNGNSVGGRVLMEYEFFPGKGGSSSLNKESSLPAEASAAAVVVAEASPTTITATNFIDLSLKLSCSK